MTGVSRLKENQNFPERLSGPVLTYDMIYARLDPGKIETHKSAGGETKVMSVVGRALV